MHPHRFNGIIEMKVMQTVFGFRYRCFLWLEVRGKTYILSYQEVVEDVTKSFSASSVYWMARRRLRFRFHCLKEFCGDYGGGVESYRAWLVKSTVPPMSRSPVNPSTPVVMASLCRATHNYYKNQVLIVMLWCGQNLWWLHFSTSGGLCHRSKTFSLLRQKFYLWTNLLPSAVYLH